MELEHIISELFKIYFEKVQLQMRRVITLLSRALDLSKKMLFRIGVSLQRIMTDQRSCGHKNSSTSAVISFIN